MGITWRSTALIILVAAWPQLGCVSLPTGKTIDPPTRPVEQKVVSTSKQELAPADVAEARWNNAEALEKSGKSQEAAALYEEIRRGGGEPAWQATRKLALLYDRQNDLDRAEQEYQKLKQLNPKDADTLCNLGWVYYRRGQFNAAYKFLSDAIYYQPDNPQACANLGMTLAQLGEHDQSLTMFKKVLSEADAYSKVAFVLNLQGKRDDALRALQTAVKLDPGNMNVRNELAQMKSAPPISPVTVARAAIPRKEQRGNVELEDMPLATASNEGMGRLMHQRPTLPPLPDLDLTAGSGHEWDCQPRKAKN